MPDAPERDPWYASWFGEEYLALYPHRDDYEAVRQAEWVFALLKPWARRAPIGFLDLACGTGRHAVELRGERGVVGLDLSLSFLVEARARGVLPRPGYLRADMRSLPFRPGTFGAVVNFFTSFGYFDDPAEDETVLREVRRALFPGGVFLSDLFNAERVLSTLVSQEEKTVAGERVSIRRSFDPLTRRLTKEIAMGSKPPVRLFRERVRVYLEPELRALHERNGFEVLEAFGDFDGSPFTPRRSPRLILLARARPEAP